MKIGSVSSLDRSITTAATVALGGFGLCLSEVAGLYVSQRSLNWDLQIAFEEQKNGPGEVSILYGEDPLADRVEFNLTYPVGSARSSHYSLRVQGRRNEKAIGPACGFPSSNW